MEFSCKLEKFGPKEAKALLETVPFENRKVSQHDVDKLVRDMINGEWEPYNGQTISINEHGQLTNGQHRMLAVIQSGCTVYILVVRGAQGTNVDLGRPRSIANVLDMEGGKFSNERVALARAFDVLVSGTYNTKKLSLSEVKNYLSLYEEDLEWARKALPAGPFSTAPIRAAFAYVKPVFDATEAADQLLTGIGHTDGSPILALQNFLNAHKGLSSRKDRWEAGLRVLSALRSVMKKVKVKYVQANQGSLDFFRELRDSQNQQKLNTENAQQESVVPRNGSAAHQSTINLDNRLDR